MALPDPRPAVEVIVNVDFHPVENSIEIVTERRVGADAVLAVAFEDRSGDQRRGLIGLSGHDGEWRRRGSSMGSLRRTRRTDLWITSGGWGVPGRGQAAVFGGWVADPDAVVARAFDLNSHVLEDEVDNGVAIFIYTEEFNLPYARLELHSADGQVLRSGPLMSRHS